MSNNTKDIPYNTIGVISNVLSHAIFVDTDDGKSLTLPKSKWDYKAETIEIGNRVTLKDGQIFPHSGDLPYTVIPEDILIDNAGLKENVLETCHTTVGKKDDNGKPRIDLIPISTYEELATVLTFGANKYADRNWEKGLRWGRVYSSLRRHLDAWWGGEDNDPETGYSHMAHVLANASFLMEFIKKKRGEDDRPQTW